MTIEKKVVQVKITGKRKENNPYKFKESEYFLTLRIVDERATNNPTQERRVSFPQYSAVNTGDTIGVNLYSPNQKKWFFSAENAELYRKKKIYLLARTSRGLE